MTNQLAKRPTDIDPEFAAIYDSVDAESASTELPRSAKPRSDSVNPPGRKEDDLEALARMAKENQANQVDRKTLSTGSQIEHDVTNIVKLGFDFLTRT